MTGPARLVVCPEARIYDHGPEHPLRPQRVLYTWSLIEACGLLERSNVSVVDELIALIQAQRNYEVNSRTIQVSDEMLQQVSNLI